MGFVFLTFVSLDLESLDFGICAFKSVFAFIGLISDLTGLQSFIESIDFCVTFTLSFCLSSEFDTVFVEMGLFVFILFPANVDALPTLFRSKHSFDDSTGFLTSFRSLDESRDVLQELFFEEEDTVGESVDFFRIFEFLKSLVGVALGVFPISPSLVLVLFTSSVSFLDFSVSLFFSDDSLSSFKCFLGS